MTKIAAQQTTSAPVHWPAKVVSALKAVRWMLAGAIVLAGIEKARRGVFTNDDIIGLMILWLFVGFVEMLLSRRLLSQPRGDANA